MKAICGLELAQDRATETWTKITQVTSRVQVKHGHRPASNKGGDLAHRHSAAVGLSVCQYVVRTAQPTGASQGVLDNSRCYYLGLLGPAHTQRLVSSMHTPWILRLDAALRSRHCPDGTTHGDASPQKLESPVKTVPARFHISTTYSKPHAVHAGVNAVLWSYSSA